jgi:hypothetical protein
LWEQFGRQDGFVMVARRLYGVAQSTGRGGDYNSAFAYLAERIERVSAKREIPSGRLQEVAVHVYYSWKVHRGVDAAPLADALSWDWFLRTIEAVIRSSDVGPSAFYTYMRALAQCHLDNWAAGLASFGELRREGGGDVWTPRDFLLSNDGRPRQVQGEVKLGSERRLYLYVPDLRRDFHARKGDLWPRPGEIAHAYVTFAFAGPGAVRRA